MHLLQLNLPHANPVSTGFCLDLIPHQSDHLPNISTESSLSVTPPIVAGCQYPIILDGHSIVASAVSNHVSSITALSILPDNTPIETLWKTRWTLTNRYLHSDYEIARGVALCSNDCNLSAPDVFKWIPKRYQTHGPVEFYQVGSLPRSFLMRLNQLRIDWMIARQLSDLDPADRRILFILGCLDSHSTASQFRKILDLLLDLNAILNQSTRNILREPELRTTIRSALRKKRADTLINYLHRKRNPTQAIYEEQLQSSVAKVKLPSNSRLLIPPNGEGIDIILNTRIGSNADLDRLIESLHANRACFRLIWSLLQNA